VTTLARTTDALRRWRVRTSVRDSLLVLVAVGFGVALGRSIANGKITYAGLVAGFVLMVALAQRPWLPYVGCIALVASVATPSSLPQFGIPGNPTLPDLVLLAAIASWFVVLARSYADRPSTFPMAPQFAMGIFLAAAVVGVLVGQAHGATSPLADARDIAYYATFWLALTALSGARRREFMLRLFAYAAVGVVIIQVAQGFVGPGLMLFYDADPTRELIGCSSGDCAEPWAQGFPRVRPPGLALVYVTACFAASYLLWGPRRRRRVAVALLAICMVGLLVSLNRNMLIGLVGGLVLTGLLAARRGRFAAVAAVGAALAIASIELVQVSPEFESNSIAARVVSIAAISELESSATVSLRLKENDAALDTLSKSPIEGVGWGVPYGLSEIVYRDGEFQTRDQFFIHNQYLGLWLRTGLVGLVAFLVALVLTLVYAARWLRSRPEDDDAWIGAGVITSVTAIGLSSIVAIYIIHPSWAPVLAGMIALATSLQKDATSTRVPGHTR
jgi:O-Antigen ligase